MERPLSKVVRRRPTLPPSHPSSTIGAERLSFRVRNGAGRFPLAMAAETLLRCERSPGSSRPNLGNYTVDAMQVKCLRQVLGLLVPVSSMHYCTSTSGLSTQSSSWGPYQVNPVGILILERVSRLDAFSGYPFRT